MFLCSLLSQLIAPQMKASCSFIHHLQRHDFVPLKPLSRNILDSHIATNLATTASNPHTHHRL